MSLPAARRHGGTTALCEPHHSTGPQCTCVPPCRSCLGRRGRLWAGRPASGSPCNRNDRHGAAEFPQAAAMLKSGHRDREEQPDLFRTRQVLIAKQLELGPEHVPGQRAATGYIFLIASRRINNRTQVHVGGNYVRQADERGRWPPRDKSTGAFLCAARCQKKPVKAPSCPGERISSQVRADVTGLLASFLRGRRTARRHR